MKITDDFHLELKPSRAYHKIDTFVVSKGEEDPGKSMKNALHVQWHGKRHLSGWSNVKQPVAFWVTWVWRDLAVS